MEKPNTPGIRILVAEDHPVVADGIVAILGKAKDMMVVARARNGAETIELLERYKPDIVLLDLRMPHADGIEVLKWMQNSGSTARAVILTIYGGEIDLHQAVKAGANAFLLKDASPNKILKTIRRVHQGRAVFPVMSTRSQSSSIDSISLEPLELKIVSLIVQGLQNRAIGLQLGLGTNAVKYHLRAIFSKLGVRRRAAAARRAIERGLIKGA